MDGSVAKWQMEKNLAILYKHNGDIPAAIQAMQNAISLAQDDPSLTLQTMIMLNFLADLCLSARLVSQAETAVRNALKLSLDSYHIFHADNLLMLAHVLLEKGNNAEAKESAESALRLYRDFRTDDPNRVQEVALEVERIRTAAETANVEIHH